MKERISRPPGLEDLVTDSFGSVALDDLRRPSMASSDMTTQTADRAPLLGDDASCLENGTMRAVGVSSAVSPDGYDSDTSLSEAGDLVDDEAWGGDDGFHENAQPGGCEHATLTEETAVDEDLNNWNEQLRSELRQVEDLRFDSLSDETQRDLIKSLEVRIFFPGEFIVSEGDDASGFYFILGNSSADVEVSKRSRGMITHLGQGKYFGEKFFISRRKTERTATIFAVTRTKIGIVNPEQFQKWDHFRFILFTKTFRLMETLPSAEQLEIYNLLNYEEYAPGEVIVSQGDYGDLFYIIIEGSADVRELDPDCGGDVSKTILITHLFAGHSFGELALVLEEPRTASVIAVEKLSCFVLSRVAFRQALARASRFHEIMYENIFEILKRREMRADARLACAFCNESSETLDTDALEDALLATGSFGTTKFSNVVCKRKVSYGDGKEKWLKINKYQTIAILGKGSYGHVYLARNEENDKKFAVKTLRRPSNKWSSVKIGSAIRAEIDIMKKLRHDHIVALEEVIDDASSPEVYLIQELLEGGPILPNETKTAPIPSSQARAYFRDMLKGVRYLHSKGIVHRDLKPQNMLLTVQNRVKIADFGAAAYTSAVPAADARGGLTAGGTPAFMAPEIYRIQRNSDSSYNMLSYSIANSTKVDVWGLGATLYNMVVGQPPWMADNELELAATVHNTELTYPPEAQNIDPSLKNLLARMLDKNPETRLSMELVYIHDWITSEGTEPLDEISSSGSSRLSSRSSSMSSTLSRQSSAIQSPSAPPLNVKENWNSASTFSMFAVVSVALAAALLVSVRYCY